MVIKWSCETDCMANVFLVLPCWNTSSSYMVLLVESVSYSMVLIVESVSCSMVLPVESMSCIL